MFYDSKHWSMVEPKKKKSKFTEKCSLCGKSFPIEPFERNMICWAMRHTETVTYEEPSYCCPECKKQLNLFMTKVLMDKKKWKVVDQNEC